jgi:hypothetical protein
MDKALFLFDLLDKLRIKFLLEGLDSVGPTLQERVVHEERWQGERKCDGLRIRGHG